MNPTDPAIARPWYRQFWPWFLILLPGSVVVASLYTLVLANQYADDLVVDEYYKEGLAINRQLKRQNQAAELGITAELAVTGRQLDMQITGPVDAPQLRLLLSHPLEASQDITVPVTQIANGHYRVMLPQAIDGRWHWIVDLGVGSNWRVDGDQRF